MIFYIFVANIKNMKALSIIGIILFVLLSIIFIVLSFEPLEIQTNINLKDTIIALRGYGLFGFCYGLAYSIVGIVYSSRKNKSEKSE